MPDFTKMTEEEIKKFLSTADEKQTADFLIWKTKEEVKKELQNNSDVFKKMIEEQVKEMTKIQKRLTILGGGEQEAYEVTANWLKALIFRDVDQIKEISSKYPQHFKQITGPGAPALVPTLLIAKIIEKLPEYAWHRKYCEIIPVASSLGSWPVETGGATAYRVGEGEAPSDSTPTFGQIAWSTYRLATYILISQNVLLSSPVAIVEFCSRKIAQAFASQESKEFAVGNPDQNEWQGITTEEIDAIDAEGALTADHLIECFGALPDQYKDLPSTIWICNGTVLTKIAKLRDTQGQREFPDILTSRTLFGKPVLLNSNFPDSEIYFGACEYYKIFDLQTYKLLTTGEGKELVTTEMTLVYASAYNNGKLALPEAFRKVINITSQGGGEGGGE